MAYLEWWLFVGPLMASFETKLRRGRPVPALDDGPQLSPALVHVWEGFHYLNDRREYGMSSPQPLQLTEMVAWLDERGTTGYHLRKRYLTILGRMDMAFCRYLNKQQAAKKGK